MWKKVELKNLAKCKVRGSRGLVRSHGGRGVYGLSNTSIANARKTFESPWIKTPGSEHKKTRGLGTQKKTGLRKQDLYPLFEKVVTTNVLIEIAGGWVNR